MSTKKIILIAAFISSVCMAVIAYKYLQKNQIQQFHVLENNDAVENKSSKEKIIEISSENDFRELLKNNEQPCVIFLHMEGCGWCKKMDPVYHEISNKPEFSPVQFYSVDGRKSQAVPLVKEFCDQQINGYPSLLFINETGYLDKQIGFSDQEDLENKIKSIFLNSKKLNKEDNVEIQTLFKTCSSNSDCTSGNCILSSNVDGDNVKGRCAPCLSNCQGIMCNNHGQCCSGGSCINNFCSDGGNACACNSNSDCNSNNCYGGLCVPCLKKAMLCSSDDQCCEPMNCLNGACFECLPVGRICSDNDECCSGYCYAGTCYCGKNACPCYSNSTCDSGNCHYKKIIAPLTMAMPSTYGTYCRNCIIPAKKLAGSYLANKIMFWNTTFNSKKDKGTRALMCYNDGQCCQVDKHGERGVVSCQDGVCIIDLPQKSNQSCTSDSQCSSNLCISGSCSCGDTGKGCTCESADTCQSGLVCTNNVCAEPCAVSGAACTSGSAECCSGYTCDSTTLTCTNNDVTCTENDDCTSGICMISADGATGGTTGACATCGDNGWQGCTTNIQCCTGSSCVIEEGATTGSCNCNGTGCTCVYNSNCESGVCVENNTGSVCAAGCLVSGATCQDSGQCCSGGEACTENSDCASNLCDNGSCSGLICMESNNKQGVSYCVSCGNTNYSCSSNDDCCSNACVNGICVCTSSGCACTNDSDGNNTCSTGVCINTGRSGGTCNSDSCVCSCIANNIPCTTNKSCCSGICGSNGKCSSH